MSLTFAGKRSVTHQVGERKSWSSVAFVVEAMFLLLFLAGSLALVSQLFAASLNVSAEARSLDAATIAASSIAERFSANPDYVEETTQLGDLFIKCDVDETPHSKGVLYKAHITVFDVKNGSVIYELDTSKYEGEVI